MPVNGRDLVKVTSTVLCIKTGDLVSCLASYACLTTTSFHISTQNSKFFSEDISQLVPCEKYVFVVIMIIIGTLFTTITTKRAIRL